jgi:hypothetical protein
LRYCWRPSSGSINLDHGFAGAANRHPFDLAQWSFLVRIQRRDMKPSDEPRRVNKEDEPPQLSRSDEALRIIEEYANHLREMIMKLRHRLHH